MRGPCPGMHVALSSSWEGRVSAVTDVDPVIVSPAWARLALAFAYVAGGLSALRGPRRSAALMLWAVVLLITLAFPFRSGRTPRPSAS